MYDRDDYSQSREIDMRELLNPPTWRQRMVQREKERQSVQAEARKKDPTGFLKDSSFKITRR